MSLICNCLRCVVDVRLTDRNRLETVREQCGTSLLRIGCCGRVLVAPWHSRDGRCMEDAIWPHGTIEGKTGSQEHSRCFWDEYGSTTRQLSRSGATLQCAALRSVHARPMTIGHRAVRLLGGFINDHWVHAPAAVYG
eukprot:363016-Chlamydomonas_euryale.AAC.2